MPDPKVPVPPLDLSSLEAFSASLAAIDGGVLGLEATTALYTAMRTLAQPSVPRGPWGSEPQPRIIDECPVCENRSIFIGSGGYLTCANLNCKNPATGHAIALLKQGSARPSDSAEALAQIVPAPTSEGRASTPKIITAVDWAPGADQHCVAVMRQHDDGRIEVLDVQMRSAASTPPPTVGADALAQGDQAVEMLRVRNELAAEYGRRERSAAPTVGEDLADLTTALQCLHAIEERRARSGSARDEGGVTTWPLRGFQSPLPEPAAADPCPTCGSYWDQHGPGGTCPPATIASAARAAAEPPPLCSDDDCPICDEPARMLDPPSEPTPSAELDLGLRWLVNYLRSVPAADGMADALESLHAAHLAAEERATRAEQLVTDYEEAQADKRRLTKEIDSIISDGHPAEQASLCDIVEPIRDIVRERDALKGELVGVRCILDAVTEAMRDVGRILGSTDLDSAFALMEAATQLKATLAQRDEELADASYHLTLNIAAVAELNRNIDELVQERDALLAELTTNG